MLKDGSSRFGDVLESVVEWHGWHQVLPDIPKYLASGIKVGMGVDGQASADLPDPFENMRVGLYFVRAKYEDASIMQPIDVLRLHTLGSAEVMGIADKVGTLEAGKFADFSVSCRSRRVSIARRCSIPTRRSCWRATVQILPPSTLAARSSSSNLGLTRADMNARFSEVEQRVGRLRRVRPGSNESVRSYP